MNTNTLEKSSDLRHSITVISDGGKTKTIIKISLGDECRNGREDFSIMADIYEKGHGNEWRVAGGGCCHDHILSVRPALAPFVALHLNDKDGTPIYAAANAFYWFAGFNGGLGQKHHDGSGRDGKNLDECRRIFANHVRATPEQVSAIVQANPRTQDELQAVLEDFGFPEQWKREADAAIAQLEVWTGKTFESKATKPGFQRLSEEKRALIAERRASGYYEPGQVAARDAAAKDERREKRLVDVQAAHEKALSKLNTETAVKLLLAEFFAGESNVIFYNHTGELQFNWSNCSKLHTREEFDSFSSWSTGKLPAGVVCKWQEKPTR